jgi:hypothetical protein
MPPISPGLRVLRNDKRVIFAAAAHAQHAVDHLQGCRIQMRKTGPLRRPFSIDDEYHCCQGYLILGSSSAPAAMEGSV